MRRVGVLAGIAWLGLVACGDEPPAPEPNASSPAATPADAAGPSPVMTAFRPRELERRAASHFSEVVGMGGRLKPVAAPGQTGVFVDFHVEGHIADADVPRLLASLQSDVTELLRSTHAALDSGFQPVGEDFDPHLANVLLRMPLPPQTGFTVRYHVGEQPGEVYVLAARTEPDHWNVAVALRENPGG